MQPRVGGVFHVVMHVVRHSSSPDELHAGLARAVLLQTTIRALRRHPALAESGAQLFVPLAIGEMAQQRCQSMAKGLKLVLIPQGMGTKRFRHPP
jgi:hypothetical protein